MVDLAEVLRSSSQARKWPLEQDEVHVWVFPLDVSPPVLSEMAATLSVAETERANRFRFARHRVRFVAGRGSLRAILGRYLQADPARLQFAYGLYGKPELAGDTAKSGLQFNLAHSVNLALLAVTRLEAVGVDLERVRLVAEAESLVARFFSRRESLAFQALPADQKLSAFFNLWTRKEAWLKATGEGISQFLNVVEVAFLPGEPAQLLWLPAQWASTSWRLYDLTSAPGFISALAVAARGAEPKIRISHWDFTLGLEER